MSRTSDRPPRLGLAPPRKDLVYPQRDAEEVVALALAEADPREAYAISETIISIGQLVRDLVGKQHRQSLESIVEALVPKTPPTPLELKEAAMLARARTAVLESGEWLTAAQIAVLAGFSASNPSAQPNKWKRDRAIFALRHHGVDYFPSYGLDAAAGYRPRKTLAPVLAAFGERRDGWGLAYWFQSLNSFLGGQRPADVLASQPERVLAAALDECAALAHG